MFVQTLKGFRDFLPKEARKRQYVINTLKDVFESYGFEPLETPALEYEEILTGKYGAEGDKLMYRFVDKGERKVALRYDQTVPLARVVAQYQNELPLPFKRYQIQPVWRAENPQKGRFREFTQCDIDTVGSDTALSDAQTIAVVIDAFQLLGFKDFKVLINDRENLKFSDDKGELAPDVNISAVRTLDKLNKIGQDGVLKELEAAGFSKSVASSILQTALTISPTPRIKEVLDYLRAFGVDMKFIEFSGTLARGLDYYTGIIFETEIKNYTGGAVCSGGRYDKLVGMFAGRDIPAIGCAFGFDRIIEAMTEQSLFPVDLTTTKALVTIFSPELLNLSIEVAYKLRANGIPTELYLDEKAKMEKQLKYADQKGIPYVVIIGTEEAEKGMATLKNLKTREQKQVILDQLPNEIN